MYQRTEAAISLPQNLSRAVRQGIGLLRAGELVAYPTDTLYGLGCDPWNREAVERLFRAKGRPPSQALPLLLAEVEALSRIAEQVSEAALEVARRFWPGALTLVVPRAPSLLPEVTGGGETVAVRLSDHPVPRSLALGLGGAIVGTSANRWGGPDPVSPQQVQEQLGDSVGLIIDGGPCRGGQGSTVLDVSGAVWKILREGPVTLRQLQEAGFKHFFALCEPTA